MTSLSDLREVVDVVIGVDTHVHTHSSAAIDAATGGVLGEIAVDGTAEGYAQLVELAGEQATLKVWGNRRHRRPWNRPRLTPGPAAGDRGRVRRTQTSQAAQLRSPTSRCDPGRSRGVARTRLGTPRSGAERQALSVLLAARRSAVQAATEAQLQVFSLVIAAPEPIRARFPGQKLPSMLATAADLRLCSSWDVETTTGIALLSLARRFRALSIEAKEREKAIKAIVRAWRPDPLEEFDAGAIVAATALCVWSHPGRIHSEAAFAMLAGVAPIPANSDKSSTAIDSTATATASSTGRCTPSSSHGSAMTARPRDYVARRTTERKIGREIKRCLSRYIARDLYRLLESGPIAA